ncbi:hypothetical protein [Dyella sp. ASV21]|uniref:hypothetical protein n=1 Tax=Dyella sp. ASV21 TaxID=2795114 RepID=UPI0018ECBF11|nr:hypothetical protein [Dyella sp. ASV21]
MTGTASGQTCVVTEIAGDEHEPMFATRRALLEPLSMAIVGALESIGGPSRPPPLTAGSPVPAGVLRVEEVPCTRCGIQVALLVFAEGATDRGQFEDVARLMYPRFAATTVPTHLIGSALGPSPETYRAAIMQVWPQRAPVETLTPAQFWRRIHALIRGHFP